MSDIQDDARQEPSLGNGSGAAGTARRTNGFGERVRAAASYLAAGILAGSVVGLLIGGVGSRLAMFILRVTTGPEAIGVLSDDQFTMGRLTTSSLFLLLFGAAAGGAVGVLYLLSRVWVPQRLRTPLFAILGALVGGSAIVHADGIDFSFLEPAWLAVVLFVALPGAGAAAIARMTEWRLERSAAIDKQRPWFFFLPLVGLLPMGPIGILVLAVTLALAALNQKVPVARFWSSAPVTMLGRTLLAVWAIVAGAALVKDISGIF